jgi:predicted dehydrogenase
MKFLVCGCGSIGKRHIGNLLELKQEVIGMDTIANSRELAKLTFNIPVVATFEEGLDMIPNAVLICTPPSSHVELAKKALHYHLHVFIEKPISDTLEGLISLQEAASEAKKVVQIGYNLRYIPRLLEIKQILESGKMGKVLSARVIFGYYLPYWRPQIDYRQCYTGQKKHGGGIVLEASHELDYISWLLGKPKTIVSIAKKASSLEIDTEDTADILVEYPNEVIANIHLDFLRKDYTRGCEIVCENGILEWNIKHPLEVGKTYVEEMKAFISAIEGKPDKNAATINDGRTALEIAMAAKL